jgi:hypothetical protein
MTANGARQLSAADMRKLWGALEDVTDELARIGAWLPGTTDRAAVERALGALMTLEWSLARRLGDTDGDDAAQPAQPAPLSDTAGIAGDVDWPALWDAASHAVAG